MAVIHQVAALVLILSADTAFSILVQNDLATLHFIGTCFAAAQAAVFVGDFRIAAILIQNKATGELIAVVSICAAPDTDRVGLFKAAGAQAEADSSNQNGRNEKTNFSHDRYSPLFYKICQVYGLSIL